MLKPRKFAIQKGIGDKVFVGTASKCGTFFIDKEDLTQEFIRTVIDMYNGTETVVTNKADHRKYSIVVAEIR